MEKIQLINLGEKLISKRVLHSRWGEGTVIGFSPEDPMQMEFEFDGIKKALMYPQCVREYLKVYDKDLADDIASALNMNSEGFLYHEEDHIDKKASTIGIVPSPVATNASKSKMVTLDEAITTFTSSESEEDAKLRYRTAERLRKSFIVDYPVDSIGSLSLDDYLIAPAGAGYDESFCSRIKNELDYIGHLGNARNDIFGIYLRGGKDIVLNKTLQNEFDDDYEAAFSAMKNSIQLLMNAAKRDDLDLLRRIESDKKRYYLYTNYMLKLLSIYFPDMFVPVYTKETIDSYCRVIQCNPNDYKLIVDKNLALMKWRDEHPVTSVWSNHYLMVFLDYMWRHNITIYDSLEANVSLDDIQISFGNKKNDKQTFMFNGIKVARIHFRKDGSSFLYVYRNCDLLKDELERSRFTVVESPDFIKEGGSGDNILCKLEIDSVDNVYIANEFLKICRVKNSIVNNSEEAMAITDRNEERISKPIERESFYSNLLLPEGFEAKRYDGMNRVHFKYRGVGFAVMDMNTYTYNLGSRDEYMHAVGVREFEYTHILGPNHAMLRGIPNADTTVLYKLFDYISAERIDWDGIESNLREEVNSIDSEIKELSLEGDEKLAVVKARVNQGVFRSLLLRRYGRCCLCGVDEFGLLVASHIKPWAASEPKEKTDVNNGLLLCPNHDRLFDKGYISFNDDGTILISDSLSDENRTSLNVHDGMSIHLSDKSTEYMKYHRENIFIDEY
ncbi:HNH endonuclease [Ruminococcaceae bacterium KH2T8]|nr:HNH endonuclease [Ruminococcaceae bacterium KH2T8]